MRKEVIEKRLAAEGDAESGAGLSRPEASNRSELVESRRFRITKAMLLKHDCFDNCQECEKSALGGKGIHSEECWLRLVRALASDDVDRCVVERAKL